MKFILRILLRAVIITILTLITQIGGLIYLLSIYLSGIIRINFRLKGIMIFLILYILFTFLINPLVAPIFGREKIINTQNIGPANMMYVILNRNYVSKRLNSMLLSVSSDLSEVNNNIHILYMDASFPYVDGFPLFPHLSHNDGNKIDLSFVYENEHGLITDQCKSVSGYGVYESAKGSEFDQVKDCLKKGYKGYSNNQYFSFGKINKELKFSKEGTRILLNTLLRNKEVSKIFIEPHLKNRLSLVDERIRFHGCYSVRHDDHIHLQI